MVSYKLSPPEVTINHTTLNRHQINNPNSRMKLLSIVGLALVVATVSSSPAAGRALQDDLNEFVDLLPVDKIIDIAVRYFLTDKDVQLTVAYITGPEFAAVWDQVFAQREIRDILDYLQEAGVDAYGFFNDLADLIGLSPVKPSEAMKEAASGRGLNDLIDDVLAVLPKKELLELFNHKLQTSVEFKAFFEKLQSTDFQKLVEFFNVSFAFLLMNILCLNCFNCFVYRTPLSCSRCSTSCESMALMWTSFWS